MESITIDGQGEEDFRRSIEALLRHGQAEAAAGKLRALIAPYAGRVLPARIMDVSANDLVLTGWDDLAHRIGEHDRPGHRISALAITLVTTDPEGGQQGPSIETHYFSDEAYPFAGATRVELLSGYLADGSAWHNRSEGSDTALSLKGIDDIQAAVARLEMQIIASSDPREHDIRAGSLGACYLAVLVHQAVLATIARSGVPRPLCVMAGTADAYPYFDAPVMSGSECREAGVITPVNIGLSPAIADARDYEDEEEDEGEETEEDANEEHGERAGRTQSYGSLLALGASMRSKKPVITVDAAEAVAASHHYELGAQHRLTIAGNSDRVGVLPALTAPDEREAAFTPGKQEPAKLWQEPELVDQIAGVTHEPPVQPAARETLPLARPSPPVAEAPERPQAPVEPFPPETYDDMPVQARDQPEVPDAIEQREDDAAAPEMAPAPAPARNPIPPPAAHSLRSRVVQQQTQHVTLTDRIVAFIQRAARWLSRFQP